MESGWLVAGAAGVQALATIVLVFVTRQYVITTKEMVGAMVAQRDQDFVLARRVKSDAAAARAREALIGRMTLKAGSRSIPREDLIHARQELDASYPLIEDPALVDIVARCIAVFRAAATASGAGPIDSGFALVVRRAADETKHALELHLRDEPVPELLEDLPPSADEALDWTTQRATALDG